MKTKAPGDKCSQSDLDGLKLRPHIQTLWPQPEDIFQFALNYLTTTCLSLQYDVLDKIDQNKSVMIGKRAAFHDVNNCMNRKLTKQSFQNSYN